MWGFHNKWIFLPVVSTIFHFLLLYSGKFYHVYCWYTEVSKQYHLSVKNVIYEFFGYTDNPLVILRSIVIVRIHSDTLNDLQAPLFEEILYRGTILPLLIQAYTSIHKAIWTGSIAFGTCIEWVFDRTHPVGHIHLMLLNIRQGRSIQSALAETGMSNVAKSSTFQPSNSCIQHCLELQYPISISAPAVFCLPFLHILFAISLVSPLLSLSTKILLPLLSEKVRSYLVDDSFLIFQRSEACTLRVFFFTQYFSQPYSTLPSSKVNSIPFVVRLVCFVQQDTIIQSTLESTKSMLNRRESKSEPLDGGDCL